MKTVEGVIIGLALAAIVGCVTFFYQNSQQDTISKNAANIIVLRDGVDSLRREFAGVTKNQMNEILKVREQVDALTNGE